MKDGFYRIWIEHENKQTVGELRTVDGMQYCYLIGFDEAFNPDDFVIVHQLCLPQYRGERIN
jgi:hypothetical protein